MSRKSTLGALVSILLMSQVCALTFAQTKAPNQKKTPAPKQARADVEITPLKIPATDPHWPHVVVLDLTAKEYQAFKAAPLAYDKQHKIYPDQPLQTITPCVELPQSAAPAPGDEPERWTVVISHGRPSVGACIASRQEKEVKKPTMKKQ